MKKDTTASYINKAKLTHGDIYNYSEVEYENSTTKIKIICRIHGAFWQKAGAHLNCGIGCPVCGRIKCTKSQSSTTQNFIEKSKLVHGDVYDYSGVLYKNNKTKVEIICPIHGSFWQTPDNHLAGHGCVGCATEKTKIVHSSTEVFVEKAKKIHNARWDYSLVVYKKAKIKVAIGCKVHGIFYQTPADHLSGRGCKQCGKIRTADSHRGTTEGFIDIALKTRDNKYDYSKSIYVNNETKVEIICPIHGSFWQTPGNHISQRQDCPKCAGCGTSKPEQELYDYLHSIYPGIILQSDRTIISPLELDIVIPDLKIAIEYNGLYWHSEEAGKDKNYHLNKTNLAKAAGYQLIHIFETEWINKQDIVRSRLKTKLGVIPTKIFARKCHITRITTGVSHFLDKNHIQGACPSSINYGLIHNNELVALMTFGAARYAKDGGFELVRYVSKLNTVVVGGASKLFKHFRTLHPGKIVSYSDRRWNTGDMYEKLGMKRMEPSHPCYWYFQPHELKLRHRSQFQKHKLEKLLKIYDGKKTELENMKENGWSRIFDCGNDVFVLD